MKVCNYLKLILIMTSFFLLACNHLLQGKIFEIKNGGAMGNTMRSGESYEFRKSDTYSINDIIALKKSNIMTKKTEISIFRVLGKSGDKIEISKGLPYVNDQLLELPSSSKHMYFCKSSIKIDLEDIDPKYQVINYENDTLLLDIDQNQLKELNAEKSYLKLMPYYIAKNSGDSYIKFNKTWNRDFFGPIVIPSHAAINDTSNVITISDLNFNQIKNDSLYFVIGDDIQNSVDSRYIGFVPKSLIIGKLAEKIK